MNLLEQYLQLTTDEARAEFLAGLTPDQLTELNGLAEEAFAAAEAEAPSDENLTTLRSIADVLQVVAGEQERRDTEAERVAAERQAVIDSVRNPTASDTGADGDGGDGDADGGDGDGAGEGDGGEGADGGEQGDGDQGDGEGADGAGNGAPESLAAGAASTLNRARPRIQANARPAGPLTASSGGGSSDRPLVALTAAAGLPVQAGSVLVAPGSNDLSGLASAVEHAYNSLAGAKGRAQAIVASARVTYPEHRQLDLNAAQNTERINAALREAQSLDPVTAAGGFCAPGTQRYELPTVGDTGRPVRDTALLNFQATRGRVRWMPSPQLADVEGAVDQWTNTDDINALSGSPVKPCLRVECPDELDATTYAVTRCLEFGNFNARTFPEQIQAITDLTAVWHDRYGEQLLLTGIDTLSLAVTHGQVLGTTSDALAALQQLIEGIRSRYRIMTTRIRVILPEFFRAMIRVDIARQIPGGQTLDERYAVADEMIARWFERLGVNITWTLDSQVFGSQGAGALIGWPSTVTARVFVEGTFSFLDGGTLDLGIVRDSVLNATNDFQMFAETFEGVAKFGPIQAYTLTMDVCSDGSTSGTVDINPCVSGS